MLKKTIACVLVSVVAAASFTGCVDRDRTATGPVGEQPPFHVPVSGGWIELPDCTDCTFVHARDEADVTIVLDRDGGELCRIGPAIDTCGVR